MKFSLDWLKQYLETGASARQIAARLTALGLEVEALEDPAERLAGFRVAKVLTAAPHPNADKLHVLTVDTGAGELQVVCGAPNARAGLVGVLNVHTVHTDFRTFRAHERCRRGEHAVKHAHVGRTRLPQRSQTVEPSSSAR